MLYNLTLFIVLSPLLFWLITFVYTAKRGSPYVPIKSNRLNPLNKFIKKGAKIADLGAGDGRVLIDAITHGASLAVGWESDFFVYLTGLYRLSKSAVKPYRARINYRFGDFWFADLSTFDVIYVYQMTKYLKPFQTKLLPQLKPGTIIISPDYEIPGLQHWKQIKDKDRGIYIYKT